MPFNEKICANFVDGPFKFIKKIDSKLFSSLLKTFVFRTQILYATDIAMIILQLELKPGTSYKILNATDIAMIILQLELKPGTLYNILYATDIAMIILQLELKPGTFI